MQQPLETLQRPSQISTSTQINHTQHGTTNFKQSSKFQAGPEHMVKQIDDGEQHRIVKTAASSWNMGY